MTDTTDPQAFTAAMPAFGVITVERWCDDYGPCPANKQITAMLDELGRRLDGRLRPVALKVESFRSPTRAAGFLAKMTAAVTLGSPIQPLRSWYQWQHPVWRWCERVLLADAPAPVEAHP